MKILNKFIWSKKEPSNKNDIWFDGSTWRMYTEEAWQSFTLPVDAADKVAKVLENASEVYQEKLNAGYGIIIEGNTISLDVSSIDVSTTHNIGSIDLFEQIIAERQNHNLTQEDKDAILNGKIITTSVGNGVVPTISSNSMGENGVVLIFHFNERLYNMFVMWTDTLCYINGVFSFAKETKLYADSELSETSENAVQNKVVTEQLTELSEEMVASQSVFTQGENNPTIWAILDMAIKNGQDNTRYVLQLKREANLQQVVVYAYAQGASSYKAYVNLVYKTSNFDIGIHTYQGMMDTGEDISIILDWDKVKGNFTGATYQLNNEVFNGGKSSLKIMAAQSDIVKLQERTQELDSVKEKNNRLILGASIFSAMPSENANALGIVDFSLKNSREGKAYMLQVNKTTSEQQVVVFCYNPSNPIYDNYVNLVYKTSNFEDGIKEYRGELTTGEKIAIIVNWELVEGKNSYRTTEYTFSDDVYNGGKSWLRIKDLETELRSLESQLGGKEVSEIYYAACGDSITNANHATIYDIAESDPYMPIDGYPELNTYKRKNYAYYIAKANNIKWANYGFGGTTLVDVKPKAFESVNLFPFSSDRMRQMKEGVTWDYISIFFGWNDCHYGVTYQKDLWLKEKYGKAIGYPMQESQIGAEGFATAEQKAACDAATGNVGGKQYDNSTDYFIARFIGTIDSTNNSTWLGAWNTTLYYLMRKHPMAKILIIAPYLDTQYNAVRDALELVAKKWGVALFDFKEIPDWFYQRERNYTTLPNPNRQDGKWQTAAGNLLGNHVEGYNIARYSYDSLHPSNLGYERMWRFINAKLI